MFRFKLSLTIALILICAIIYVGYQLDTSPDSWEKSERWGEYYTDSLWDGAYWGYVTSAFVHYDLIHIIFNMYWLFILGQVLENEIGSVKMLLLVILSSIVTSGVQFLVSEGTGVGFSGALYCFFGFMWMTKRKFTSFLSVLTPKVIQLFTGWLFLCIILTQLEVMQIANAAHFSGILLGIALGKAVMSKKYMITWFAAAGCMTVIAITPLFWFPHSASWLCYKSEIAYEKGEFQKEIEYLTKAIKIDDTYAWAYYSRGWTYEEIGKTDLAEIDFKKARKLDPTLFDD